VGPPGTAAKLADGLKGHGAEKIYIAETDRTDFLTPEVDVLTSLVESLSPTAVLIGVSADGKEIAGRVAVRTGSALLGDVVAVRAESVTHIVFGGAFTAEAKANTAHPVITVRSASVEIEPVTGAGAEQAPATVPGRGRDLGTRCAGGAGAAR
jgi:electron transfer flavoprotein alpha subunit